MSDDDEQKESQKKPLLTLAIELGDKNKQLLNIYLDSKPEQLAYDFCLQNNLDFDSMQNLIEEIKNALANYNADTSNQENKNKKQEEVDQDALLKKEDNEEKEVEENKENEEEHKTEELSDAHEHEQEQEQEEYEQEQEEQNIENVKEEKEEKEKANIEKEEEKEGEKEDKEKKEELDIKQEKEEKEEKEQEEKLDKAQSNKEEAAEEDLLKEEERDKVLDQNNEKENSLENNEENEEEDEDLPSYLSPTICFQNKQRQIAQAKPKPEFADFDTSYKKIDKISEFSKEKHEKVVTHLTINTNNQKYLPKDYYDNPENKNFGERLYNREKILKEEAMEKARLKAKKENKKKEDEMTFIPKINDYNLIALQNRKQNKMQYNEEKRILNYKDYLKAKEEHTKNKHYADIEKENTFAPKINKNSEKMAGNRSLQVPRYEQLYKKKVDIKKLEDKIYDDKNMFKPKINKNYKGVKTDNNIDNKIIEIKKINEYANLTFEERQKRFKEKVEENKEKLMELKNKNIDQKTGKKYFKPTINKNKKLDIERKNKKVFNELYRDSAKYKIKKEELVKKINELEKGLY